MRPRLRAKQAPSELELSLVHVLEHELSVSASACSSVLICRIRVVIFVASASQIGALLGTTSRFREVIALNSLRLSTTDARLAVLGLVA